MIADSSPSFFPGSRFLRRRLCAACFRTLAALPFALAIVSRAATNDWIHTAGGSSWFSPANWSVDVPSAADEVFIGNDTTAFVEGAATAVANNVFIENGGLTIGNIGPGNLAVNGEIAVGSSGSSGRLNLNFGTVSLNTLTVGQSGTYSDTTFGRLILTGIDPTIRMANGVNVTVNSRVSGSAGLIKDGLGTLILANDNDYTGGTTISLGALQIGNGGTSGSLGTGDVVNNGSLVFNRSDSITVGNLISGTGDLRQSGSGTLILTADNTYGGGTTIASGTLQVGDGGTTGSLGSGGVTNNSALVFNRSDQITVANPISGSGTLSQSGAGTLVLTGNNTYTGATIITNGTLQVGDGGTSGSLGAGNVSNDGALVFNRSDQITVSNLITGSGSLTQAGAGTLVLAANNSYTGTTTISNGTLQVGNGGSTGSIGTNAVINHGTLAFNRSNSIVVHNEISGTGRLTQAGTGVLALSATNTYSGGTSIENGGTLVVQNGSALGSGSLNLSSGTLRMDSLSATNRLALNVGGDYSQSADGTLELAIRGGAPHEFDRLDISGTAAVDGVLRIVGANDYVPFHNHEFILLSAAGGLAGTFAGFTNLIEHSPLLDPELVYGANDIVLRWVQLSFQPFALTPNQLAVARGLDSIAGSTASNDVRLIQFLDYLPDLTNQLPAAFDQIAPTELSAMMIASFAAMDVQGRHFLERADELRTDYRSLVQREGNRVRPEAESFFNEMVDNPWSVHMELPVNFIGVKGSGMVGGYDLASAGFLAGADRRVAPNWIAGGSFSYLNTGGDLGGGGDLNLDTAGLELHGIWFNEGWHAAAMIGGAFNSYETSRRAIQGTANGDTSGFAWTGLLAGGYEWHSGRWEFGSEAAVQYTAASISGFAEKGSFSPLRIESQSESSLHSQLGFSVRYRGYRPGTWTFIVPEAYLGWRHDFLGNEISVDSRFASGAGDIFRVDGPKLGSDSIVGSLGLTVVWKPTLSTYVNFGMLMGRTGYDSRSLNVGMILSF